MAKSGIRQNVTKIFVSGARVMFDPRTTQDAHEGRDDKNYKTDERPMREAAWRKREAEKRRQAKQAAE